MRSARYSAVALIAGSLALAGSYAQGTAVPGPTTQGASTNPQAGAPDTTTADREANRTTSGSSDASAAGTSSASDAKSHGSLEKSEKKFITKVAESSPKELAIARLAVQRASNPQVKSYAQQIISDHQQMNQELIQIAQQKGITLENQALLTTGAGQRTTSGQYGVSGSASSDASTNAGIASNTGAPRGTGAAGTASTGASTGVGSSGMTAATSTSGQTASASADASLPAEIANDRHYRSLSQKSGAEFDREFVEMMVEDHREDLELFREQADQANDSQVRQFASRHASVLQGHLDRAEMLSQSAAE